MRGGIIRDEFRRFLMKALNTTEIGVSSRVMSHELARAKPAQQTLPYLPTYVPFLKSTITFVMHVWPICTH
jgi:hypothetical protein